MSQRDFFAFCTSLKPADLKVLGRLSTVHHLEAARVLFAPGDPGDTLYIVTRGVLEMLPPNARENSKGILLERGDVVGEVEALSQTTRTHLVRARGPVSLQCFPRSNFQELLRRIPEFYYYLCEQLAHRLRKERELAGKHGDSLELGGRLSNFDLTTIHQAIVSSGQTGEMAIRDDEGQVIGAFYFMMGHLHAGWFHHLTGEEAFWQLFLIQHLSGSFSFDSREHLAGDDWLEYRKIQRNDTELLLMGLQFRDELDVFKKSMPLRSEKVQLLTSDRDSDTEFRHDLRSAAAQIRQRLTRGPMTIEELYRQGSVCEIKIYKVISELLHAKEVGFVGANSDRDRAETLLSEPAITR